METEEIIYQHIDIDALDQRMSLPSRWLSKATSLSHNIHQRRANFNRMTQELSGLQKGRPLFKQLPDDVVPYMFPFLIDQPDDLFPKLKQQGLAIWRWDNMSIWREQGKSTPVCDISERYSQQLLQLPCHQALDSKRVGLGDKNCPRNRRLKTRTDTTDTSKSGFGSSESR